jgi:hypothetical protein
MTKKRLLLIAALPLALAVIIGVLAMLPTRPGVTSTNFDRIEDGMLLEEVEAIFGRPGEWSDRKESRDCPNTFIWFTHDSPGYGSATIAFDAQRRVIDTRWIPPETFLEMLGRRLRLD